MGVIETAILTTKGYNPSIAAMLQLLPEAAHRKNCKSFGKYPRFSQQNVWKQDPDLKIQKIPLRCHARWCKAGRKHLFSPQWRDDKTTNTIWHLYVVNCIIGDQRTSCLTEATTSCSNCYNSGWFPGFPNIVFQSSQRCIRWHIKWVIFLFRYPKIMTDEGIRVVRQWLGSSNHLEEGRCAHVFTRPFHPVGHLKLNLPTNSASTSIN